MANGAIVIGGEMNSEIARLNWHGICLLLQAARGWSLETNQAISTAELDDETATCSFEGHGEEDHLAPGGRDHRGI